MSRFDSDNPFGDEDGIDAFLGELDRESLLDEDDDLVGGLDEDDLALLAPPKRPVPAAPVKKTRGKPRK